MWYEPKFKDREHAGRELAAHLGEFSGRDDVVVLALPRGGVPVAYEVAETLRAPFDVFIVRKLGVPGQEELAFGAIATGGVTVLNEGILPVLRIPAKLLGKVADREKAELHRREQLYRAGRPPIDVKGKIVMVIDDGLATGATMTAAVKALKQLGPKEIIVAVPVASRSTCDEIGAQTNVRSICVATPEPFHGVSMWYEHFSQTTDLEVQELLAASIQNAAQMHLK